MKTIRMPKELLAKWLAALRSGEYAQGREQLCDADGKSFCCLGVLMACTGDDVPRTAYPPHSWLSDRRVSFCEADGQPRGNQPYLPALTAYAGDANDGGRTFAEIADAIEACAEGV